MKRNCFVCGESNEKILEESHDVPVYLFDAPDRKRRKAQADNYGRHLLCKKCHDIYEKTLFGYLFNCLSPQQRAFLISKAIEFSNKYYKSANKGNGL